MAPYFAPASIRFSGTINAPSTLTNTQPSKPVLSTPAISLDKVDFKPQSAIPNELKPKLRNAISLLYGKHRTEEILQHVETIVQQVQKNRPKDLLKEDFSRPANWHQSESVYSLYPDRFGTVDGKPTTFKTLIPMLGYLKKLGVSTLYVLPFMESPMIDGGFDISNFKNVRKELGGNTEFDEFAAAAKKLGFKLKADLVLNHVSDQHAWFQAALKGNPEKLNYFITKNTEPVFSKKVSVSKAPRIYALHKESFGVDSKRILQFPSMFDTQYRKENIQGKDTYFYHTFYPHQLDLNWKNPKVLYEGLNIMGYWANKGIDMFRMDAVKHLVKNPGTTGEHLPETHALTQILSLALQAMSPRSLLWMEVYGPHKRVKPYFGEDETYKLTVPGEGLKTVTRTDKGQVSYDFASMPTLVKTLVDGDSRHFWKNAQNRAGIPNSASWGNFLRMHDNNTRLSNLLNHSPERVSQAYTILHSLPGIPMIYYGDEIMAKDNPQFVQEIAEKRRQEAALKKKKVFTKSFSDDRDMVRSPISKEDFENATQDIQSPANQVFHQIQKSQQVRRENPTLTQGNLEKIQTESEHTFSYLRSHQNDNILVANNLSNNSSKATLHLPDHFKLKSTITELQDLLTNESKKVRVEASDNALEITLKPYESLWLKLKPDALLRKMIKV
jgi:maltose alpha-D-glucosyltransferase / alpha-amylase